MTLIIAQKKIKTQKKKKSDNPVDIILCLPDWLWLTVGCRAPAYLTTLDGKTQAIMDKENPTYFQNGMEKVGGQTGSALWWETSSEKEKKNHTIPPIFSETTKTEHNSLWQDKKKKL